MSEAIDAARDAHRTHNARCRQCQNAVYQTELCDEGVRLFRVWEDAHMAMVLGKEKRDVGLPQP